MGDIERFPDNPPVLSFMRRDKTTQLWYSISNRGSVFRASCMTDNQEFENYLEARQWIHTMMDLAL